jgi:HEAT repeat protein
VQLEAIDAVMTMVLAPPPDPRTAAKVGSHTGGLAADLFEAGPLAVLPRTLPESIFVNLAASLRDDDARVRDAAASALGVLGGSQAIAGELRTALVNDFVYGTQEPDAATRAAIARAAGVVFAMPDLEEPPGAIGDALIATMNDPDGRVRIAAMDALGWLKERRAAQALADRAVFYRKGDEALSALHALARVGPAKSGDVFRARLGAPDRAVRVVAIEGLGRAGDREDVDGINGILQRESNAAVLLAGAFAYYLLGEHGNLDRIIAALTVPDTARQARAYVTELCPEAANRLEQYLQQPDPRVRQSAAEMLGLCGHPASAGALEIAARDSDRAAAEAARQALIRLRARPAGVRLH